MSTISLTPPTSPPDQQQQLLGDPKLNMMPGMSGTAGGGGGYHHNGASMDPMYGMPDIVASPKAVANKLAEKIWKDWTLPRDTTTTTTTGRVSPSGSVQAGGGPPSVSSNSGWVILLTCFLFFYIGWPVATFNILYMLIYTLTCLLLSLPLQGSILEFWRSLISRPSSLAVTGTKGS